MSKDRPDVTDRGHYKYKLAIRLQTCIQEYEEAMDAFFAKGGPSDVEISSVILDQARRFAAGVLKATEELNPIPGRPDDYGLVGPELSEFSQEMENRIAELRGKLKGYEKLEWLFANEFRNIVSGSVPSTDTSLGLVWQILFAACMEEAIETTQRVATRLLQLATIRVTTKPTKTTLAFLREVSRCFIWGFDLACVVLCRSVLDVGTEAAGLKGKVLHDRIESAPDSVLDSEQKEKAHGVRKVGRDGVHQMPCPKQDSLCVIKDTLAVLQRLTTTSEC